MDALIVFAKVPTPGRVKTRLCPPMTPEEACNLYAAMLRDALAGYVRLGMAVRLYVSQDDVAMPEGLVPSGITTHRQAGTDLGARMLRAFLETFAAGANRAVVIGTDHPTLPLDFVRLAFDELTTPRTVTLGPTDDGGYYLVGMRDLHPALFAGMTYSHPRVLDDTLARAASADLDVTLLPTWYDVDAPGDLARLRTDLADAPDLAPRTAAVLSALTLP
ncbi:MAG TPA: TIGR04282 family arsenosugar biosynthesis glycosyltransferase [Rhodothermales bacterium]|nr:TIGR04282 family arsenosugar biosynthesis glycosyltransferase [Rhodothermales bacterium]